MGGGVGRASGAPVHGDAGRLAGAADGSLAACVRMFTEGQACGLCLLWPTVAGAAQRGRTACRPQWGALGPGRGTRKAGSACRELTPARLLGMEAAA